MNPIGLLHHTSIAMWYTQCLQDFLLMLSNFHSYIIQCMCVRRLCLKLQFIRVELMWVIIRFNPFNGPYMESNVYLATLIYDLVPLTPDLPSYL